MQERKLTGNEMFGVVKKGCERILGKVGINRKKKQKKVLFYSDVNGNYEWVEGGDDTKEFKYEGEVEKGNQMVKGILLIGGFFYTVGNGRMVKNGTGQNILDMKTFMIFIPVNIRRMNFMDREL